MDQPETTSIRDCIDELDAALLALVEQRVALARMIIRRKQAQGLPVVDRQREQQLIENLQRQPWQHLTHSDIEKIMTGIIAIGKPATES